MHPTKLFLSLLPFLVSLYFKPNKNNTCRSYLGYLHIYSSSDCYHNPDLDDDIFEIVRRHIGFFETHQVETEDGYILTLFRIPRQNPKGVVFFDHPLNFDAAIWVAQYDESIAFLFWRAGYDVWLGNGRSSYYTRHKTLSVENGAFWNFSFHEMGYYDSHAVVEYIGEETRDKVIYLGYCLGAMNALVYASTRANSSRSLKMIIPIAPVSHLHKTTSVAPYVFFFQKEISFFYPFVTVFPTNPLILNLMRNMIISFPLKMVLFCLNIPFFGWNLEEYDVSLINMITKLLLSSAIPFKMVDHFWQIYYASGSFQMYDYGERRNLEMYGNGKAPVYPVGKIETPVFLVYGLGDILSHPKDNEVLYRSLSKKARVYGRLEVKEINHAHFMCGKRKNRVYKTILRLLDRIK